MSLNFEPKMSKYLHSAAVKNGVPLSGNFELTQNCNFSCPMCYVHESKRKNELDTKTWLSLAEQAKNEGTLFLLLTGGEPFLRDDFEELYTAFSKMGFLISVNTNGSLVENYLPLLKKYPPFRINVSLYAAQREAYKSFCKADKFESVVGSIEALQKSGIAVRLNSVFTAENAFQAPEIVRFAKEHNLHLKSTSYAYPQIRTGSLCGENAARLSAAEAARCEVETDLLKYGEEAYAAKAQRLFFEETKSDNAEEFRKVRCRGGRSSFWLTWDGKMHPCAMLPTPETEPLKVGFAAAWKELLKKVGEIRLPQECSVCKRRSACPVCAAMCFGETGEFGKKPEYVCRFFNEICRLGKEKTKAVTQVKEEYIVKSFEEEFDDC